MVDRIIELSDLKQGFVEVLEYLEMEYLTKDTEGQKKDSPIKNTDESSLVAGTGLSFISFRMDINGGLTKKSSDHFLIFLFTFPFTY